MAAAYLTRQRRTKRGADEASVRKLGAPRGSGLSPSGDSSDSSDIISPPKSPRGKETKNYWRKTSDPPKISKCPVAATADQISVRAVTHFVVLSRSTSEWQSTLVAAANFCASTEKRLQAAGYAVQTLRIVTNPFGEYLDTSSAAAAVAGVKQLEAILEGDAMPSGTRIRFALGEARSASELELVPALIRAASDLANCCVNVQLDGATGLPDADMMAAAARCCTTLATTTAGGEGNFNFTANFNMPPGCPYFPAAYNTTARGASFGIGLEYPGLLVSALQGLPADATMAQRFEALRAAVAPHMEAVDTVCRQAAAAAAAAATAADEGAPGAAPPSYIGIDTSAAPSKDAPSLCRVCELLGLRHFGAAGTLAVAQLLTRLFKSFGVAQGGSVELLGFSGFMLACLEDAGLAEAAAKGQFSITGLNAYSAVCGIGLDTVPIPGDTPASKIEALMSDTGTMAFRLNKPLTVRLFPCPGLKAGEMTTFTSADLCNCAVFAVP